MNKIKPCAKCGKPLGFSYYISHEKPGRFHQECVPRVQAEEAALAKAKLPGRKVTRKEALAIAENVMIEAERRREEAFGFKIDSGHYRKSRPIFDPDAEAAHGDPPYPHELVARVREMAADCKAFCEAVDDCSVADRDYDARAKTGRRIGEKYWPKDYADGFELHSDNVEWIAGHLHAAADLLAMIEPPAEKAGKDTPE